MANPIVRQALYLEVADRLRNMIRCRELASGAWIDEVQLTGALGISRTPLREALKVLATEGLVRLEPRRGCFVNELSLQDLEDIFPLMAMLEGRCAHEATLKASDAELAGLESLHQQLQAQAAARDVDAYYETNAQIHEAVQALANNRWLSDMVGNLRKVLGLFRHKSLTVPGRIDESCAEHIAIFAALKARNPEAADALARKHLLRQLKVLRLIARQADAESASPSHVDESAGTSFAGKPASSGKSAVNAQSAEHFDSANPAQTASVDAACADPNAGGAADTGSSLSSSHSSATQEVAHDRSRLQSARTRRSATGG